MIPILCTFLNTTVNSRCNFLSMFLYWNVPYSAINLGNKKVYIKRVIPLFATPMVTSRSRSVTSRSFSGWDKGVIFFPCFYHWNFPYSAIKPLKQNVWIEIVNQLIATLVMVRTRFCAAPSDVIGHDHPPSTHVQSESNFSLYHSVLGVFSPSMKHSPVQLKVTCTLKSNV